MLTIAIDGRIVAWPEAFIAGPAEAIERAGLIRMGSTARGQQEKHVLYALAQRALVALEDADLLIQRHSADRKLSVDYGDLTFACRKGSVLFVDGAQRICVHSHDDVKVAAMLKAFYRYAARMIRLDLG
jgi:hypothetical protein